MGICAAASAAIPTQLLVGWGERYMPINVGWWNMYIYYYQKEGTYIQT